MNLIYRTKYCLLFLFFLLSICLSTAQNDTKLDSFNAVWADSSLPVEERLDAIMFAVLAGLGFSLK